MNARWIVDRATSFVARPLEGHVAGTSEAELGVIVLNWNNTTDTIDCLHAMVVWSQLTPEVWVVDNASVDGGLGIEQAYPRAHLIRSRENLGFAGGNNLVLQVALDTGCDFILLLNNDARIDEADLQMLLEALRCDTTIGVIGPVLRDRHPPHDVLAMGGRDIARFGMSHHMTAPREAVLMEVDYVPGTAVLIRAEVFQRAGLLDDRYFFGGELADLCERARGWGLRSVIHLQTRALHDVARSSQLRDSLHVYYVIRNRFLFIRKFRERQRVWLFAYWSVYGLLMSVMALLRRSTHRARALRLGVWHGLTQRYGGRNGEVWPELKTTP